MLPDNLLGKAFLKEIVPEHLQKLHFTQDRDSEPCWQIHHGARALQAGTKGCSVQTVGPSPPRLRHLRPVPRSGTTRSLHRRPSHPRARNASELQCRICTDIGIFTRANAAMI